MHATSRCRAVGTATETRSGLRLLQHRPRTLICRDAKLAGARGFAPICVRIRNRDQFHVGQLRIDPNVMPPDGTDADDRRFQHCLPDQITDHRRMNSPSDTGKCVENALQWTDLPCVRGCGNWQTSSDPLRNEAASRPNRTWRTGKASPSPGKWRPQRQAHPTKSPARRAQRQPVIGNRAGDDRARADHGEAADSMPGNRIAPGTDRSSGATRISPTSQSSSVLRRPSGVTARG